VCVCVCVCVCSVDRLLLLKLLHGCSSSDLQQETASVLLSALHNTLDFSCGSALDLTDTKKQEHLKLTNKDCKLITSVLQKTQSVVKLVLQDCEISDTALKQLWPILPRVQLRWEISDWYLSLLISHSPVIYLHINSLYILIVLFFLSSVAVKLCCCSFWLVSVKMDLREALRGGLRLFHRL